MNVLARRKVQSTKNALDGIREKCKKELAQSNSKLDKLQTLLNRRKPSIDDNKNNTFAHNRDKGYY